MCLKKKYNAKVLGFREDRERIPDIDIMLNDENFSNYLDLRNFATNSIRMK